MASSDLNSVTIVGRLTRDVDMRYSQSGSAIASLSIAVNRSRKEGDQWISEANFFDVSFFGKSAEALRPYLTKGKQIAVQGALKQDRWEKDGQKFSKVQIVASNIQLLGGRSDNGGAAQGYNSGAGQEHQAFAPRQNYDSVPADADSFGGDGGEFPEDIPF
ncbi:MAG TPA: single-stranded DNA-binding protein [Treponema sp.]|jgi:single-strand DNA-binding protein|nr:single-stranded DNA-binding protein [Treponema sp.]